MSGRATRRLKSIVYSMAKFSHSSNSICVSRDVKNAINDDTTCILLLSSWDYVRQYSADRFDKPPAPILSNVRSSSTRFCTDGKARLRGKQDKRYTVGPVACDDRGGRSFWKSAVNRGVVTMDGIRVCQNTQTITCDIDGCTVVHCAVTSADGEKNNGVSKPQCNISAFPDCQFFRIEVSILSHRSVGSITFLIRPLSVHGDWRQ